MHIKVGFRFDHLVEPNNTAMGIFKLLCILILGES